MIGDMQEMSVSDASPPPLIAAGEAGSVSAQLWKLFSATPCKKAVRFFEFSLCVSRACLGKMFVCIDKWLKQTDFTYQGRHHNL